MVLPRLAAVQLGARVFAAFPAFVVQIENDVYSQIGLVMLIGLAAKKCHPRRGIREG
jgi:multidrug efflux pump subunit AcrB